MKKFLFAAMLWCGSICVTFGQESIFGKTNDWLTDKNFSIRKTFDGSKNENKPAAFSFQENHQSRNDFINIDIAAKLSQLELLKNSSSVLIFYPKVEWHKSTDSSDLKNKLDGGVNFEYIPFGLRSPGLPDGLPNPGLKIAPWFQGTSSFKRNLVDKVNEAKLALQLSLASNYNFLPGANINDRKGNFRARYYPYLGIEYHRLPDLIAEGQTEEFSSYFVRLFAEVWLLPQTLQINLDGTYRKVLNNKTLLRTDLPVLAASVYLYPGKQQSFAIGYEYRHGYDADSKFQLVQMSSLKLAWKL